MSGQTEKHTMLFFRGPLHGWIKPIYALAEEGGH